MSSCLLLDKYNNSAAACPFNPVRLAFEISTPVDEIRVLDHQNPANIDEDTIILVITFEHSFTTPHTILFVVTKFRRLKDLLLYMRS
jgi:hypothetical protein